MANRAHRARDAGAYLAAPGRLAAIVSAELIGVGTTWAVALGMPGAARAVRNGAFDAFSLRAVWWVGQSMASLPQTTPSGAVEALGLAANYLESRASTLLGQHAYLGYLLVLAGLLTWISATLFRTRKGVVARLAGLRSPPRRPPSSLPMRQSIGLGGKSVFAGVVLLGGEVLAVEGIVRTLTLVRWSDWVYVAVTGGLALLAGLGMIRYWVGSDRQRVGDAEAARAEAERVARLRRWTQAQRREQARRPAPGPSVSGPVYEGDFETLKRLGLFQTIRDEDGTAQPTARPSGPSAEARRRAPTTPPRPEPPPEPIRIDYGEAPKEVTDACVLLDLRLGPSLTIAQVESSYRELVDLVHPDRNPSPLSTKQTVRLNNARDALVEYLQSTGKNR